MFAFYSIALWHMWPDRSGRTRANAWTERLWKLLKLFTQF